MGFKWVVLLLNLIGNTKLKKLDVFSWAHEAYDDGFGGLSQVF